MGTTGLLAPTTVITALDDGRTMPVGPIDVVFRLTPDTEAPAELNFHLPQSESLCMAEDACPTLHNLHSLCGAQVPCRSPWSSTTSGFGSTARPRHRIR